MAMVSPSVLSADFSDLKSQVRMVERYASRFHFDAMDGHFVPNITFGPVVLAGLRKCTSLPIEADLMIEHPGRFVDDFAGSGADIIVVHVEADRHIHRTLGRIRDLGKKAGVSLNPATPVSSIGYILHDVDEVLVMTVNPGFGGQRFIESMIPKIRELKKAISESRLPVEIVVDGGINLDTGKKCVAAGADVLVAGSFIYGSRSPVSAIRALKKL
ncbi:ribulose-phosphate 3-epimerase [Candidatus Woesearchaeota archaeon]|nr:ribulose-phosphate 3-epimerase [Candidatus Woesearchaeota archaeon]